MSQKVYWKQHAKRWWKMERVVVLLASCLNGCFSFLLLLQQIIANWVA